MIENLGGRKFLFSILVVILSLILALQKFITPQEWVDLAKFLLATYVAGNVVTKFALRQ